MPWTHNPILDSTMPVGIRFDRQQGTIPYGYETRRHSIDSYLRIGWAFGRNLKSPNQLPGLDIGQSLGPYYVHQYPSLRHVSIEIEFLVVGSCTVVCLKSSRKTKQNQKGKEEKH